MKFLQWLLLGAGILILGGILLHRQFPAGRHSEISSPGRKTFLNMEFPFEAVAVIRISRPGEKGVTLTRKAGTEGGAEEWSIPECSGYPASLSMLRRLFWDLTQVPFLEMPQEFLSFPEEYGLSPEQGTLLEFRKEDGSLLFSVLAGKVTEASDGNSSAQGRYFQWNGRICLATGTFSLLDLPADGWCRPLPAFTPPQRLSYEAGGDSWSISYQPEKNAYLLEPLFGKEEMPQQFLTAEQTDLILAGLKRGLEQLVPRPADFSRPVICRWVAEFSENQKWTISVLEPEEGIVWFRVHREPETEEIREEMQWEYRMRPPWLRKAMIPRNVLQVSP